MRTFTSVYQNSLFSEAKPTCHRPLVLPRHVIILSYCKRSQRFFGIVINVHKVFFLYHPVQVRLGSFYALLNHPRPLPSGRLALTSRFSGLEYLSLPLGVFADFQVMIAFYVIFDVTGNPSVNKAGFFLVGKRKTVNMSRQRIHTPYQPRCGQGYQ